MKTISRAPLALRVAKSMSRSRIRGAGFLLRRLRNLGLLERIVQYELGNVKFEVPLWRLPWDYVDVVNYETKLIDAFCRAIAPLRQVVFFDCGADIGTFSSLVCSRMDRISRIVAFEPNSDTQQFLTGNLAHLHVCSEVVKKAVSNFEGRGYLQRPEYDASDHARFLAPGDGPVDVTTIDNMNVLGGGDVAIKADLEGGELEALQGAGKTIAAARECVVTVEAHPLVAQRLRRDPVDVLRYLESVRPFHFVVAETGQHLSTATPVLKAGQTDIWNVVGYTHDALPAENRRLSQLSAP